MDEDVHGEYEESDSDNRDQVQAMFKILGIDLSDEEDDNTETGKKSQLPRKNKRWTDEENALIKDMIYYPEKYPKERRSYFEENKRTEAAVDSAIRRVKKTLKRGSYPNPPHPAKGRKRIRQNEEQSSSKRFATTPELSPNGNQDKQFNDDNDNGHSIEHGDGNSEDVNQIVNQDHAGERAGEPLLEEVPEGLADKPSIREIVNQEHAGERAGEPQELLKDAPEGRIAQADKHSPIPENINEEDVDAQFKLHLEATWTLFEQRATEVKTLKQKLFDLEATLKEKDEEIVTLHNKLLDKDKKLEDLNKKVMIIEDKAKEIQLVISGQH